MGIDPETEYTFVAIDPGTHHTGIAIYECTRDYSPITIDAYTIVSDRIPKDRYEDILLSHNERMVNSRAISTKYLECLWVNDPHSVCCEAPFFNRLRPGAYAPLVELVYELRNTTIEYSPLVPFLVYEPMYVKKAMTGIGNADKTMVSASVMGNTTIMACLTVDASQLSEHAIDAIAVGWTHLNQLRISCRVAR